MDISPNVSSPQTLTKIGIGDNIKWVATHNGVILPKGAYIPGDFTPNPNRIGSFGIFENGKFIEKLRIDIGTPPGFKGPNVSHFHLNGGKKHIFNINKWPWWK